MKYLTVVLLMLASLTLFSQSEGQSFCAGVREDSYFPLDVKFKKILWLDAYYYEKPVGAIEKNGHKYTDFSQEWNAGNIEHLYLREENGIVYQYEACCEGETVRFNTAFKKDHSWKTVDYKTIYTIKSLKGKLNTPYCEYENLMIVEAKFTDVTFNFYYQKGYGYVGATQSGKLISCVTPEWDEKK